MKLGDILGKFTTDTIREGAEKATEKAKEFAQFALDVESITEHTIEKFQESMTEHVSGLERREDADSYVYAHAADILERMSDASLVYSSSVIDLKKRRHTVESSTVSLPRRMKMLKVLDANINLLESSYKQIFGLVDIESPRSMTHYYTQAEIVNLQNRNKRSRSTPESIRIPDGLRALLSDEHVKSYMPSEELCKKVKPNRPHVSAEVVLKGICLGDYIGQPYEFLLDFEDYDIGNPYDVKANKFTDDSVMAIAIYDACLAIKRLLSSAIKDCGVVPVSLDIFTTTMRYYGKLYSDIGYGHKFHGWVVNNGDDYDSWANGGAMRSGAIGAIFMNVEDVIRYAIVASYPTHSHPVGERGAVLTAVCVWLANRGASKADIRNYVYAQVSDIVAGAEDKDKQEKIFDLSLTPDELNGLNTDEFSTKTLSGVRTLSQALINFFDSKNLITCISNAMKYPCDSDTVAAISGGIAAAYYDRDDTPMMDEIVSHKDDVAVVYSTRDVMRKLSAL